MDGVQTRLSDSLQYRIALGLSALVSLVALIAGVLSFRVTYNEAHEMQDTHLQQVAYLINPHNPLLQQDTGEGMDFPEKSSRLPVPRVVIQDLSSPNINLIFDDEQAQHELAKFPDGLADFTTAEHDWRIYIHSYENIRFVVAQRAAFRNRIAIDSAWGTVIPLVLLIPLLWILIALLVRSMFRSISRLKSELDARAEQNLEPLSIKNTPTEIHPFVQAINQLFARVESAIEHDRRFIGNAAHELRTPMTALSLQLNRLAQVDDDAQARAHQQEQIRKSLNRTQQLLEQLLSMARAQNKPVAALRQSASLLEALRQVSEEVLPLALARDIDFGVLVDADARLAMDATDLRTILKNLIENAIRYTPLGGQVDVRSEKTEFGALYLWVEDTGAGIALSERERIFEPFYRILGNQEPGSGLGLAIVKTLADKWNLEIILGDSTIEWRAPHTGLAVGVVVDAFLWRPVFEAA